MRRRRYLVSCALAAGSVSAGCTGDSETEDDDGRNDAYRRAFREELTEAGMEVLALGIDEGVVDLAYAPGDLPPDADETKYEARIEATVETGARAYYDRVYGGWDVERLDAAVRVDDSLVATWHMESAWVRQHLDGDITREELGRKVEGSVERRDSGGSEGEADTANESA